MAELRVEIPEDIKSEIKVISKIEWSIVVNKLFREEFERIRRLKRIQSKSKLSKKKAREISEKINESLAKRYEKLLKESG